MVRVLVGGGRKRKDGGRKDLGFRVSKGLGILVLGLGFGFGEFRVRVWFW